MDATVSLWTTEKGSENSNKSRIQFKQNGNKKGNIRGEAGAKDATVSLSTTETGSEYSNKYRTQFKQNGNETGNIRGNECNCFSLDNRNRFRE